ncbi:hypothetical protein [Spirosoma pollinicola]|uniref:Uncharacterized protein n=1 Tax=Spirosoma pollinicola TaxID=2057025 RepID=A0A2K8YTS9_9BACT|nr:hypothetical protein [Spirosoma pollinicola]AUD00989.1 hypothetical protein CWM47_03630 [Spirosoma pollinicola]
MLQSLRNIESVKAQSVLADITISFLPNPYETSYITNSFGDIHKLVLQEVRKRTYVKEDDNSLKARTKILSFLTTEMTNLSLTPERKKKAKERLGDIGILPIHDYKVKFTNTFKSFEDMGIKTSHISNAILRSDKYFHVEDIKTPISFFTKKINTELPEDVFILLIITSREKASLVVRGAWRVYLSEVNASDDYNPYQLFLTFLERYGLTIRVSNSDWAKFIPFEVVTSQSENLPYLVKYQNLDTNTQQFMSCAVVKKTSVINVYEVFCIYSVDIDMYQHDLRKHGIEFSNKFDIRNQFVIHTETFQLP